MEKKSFSGKIFAFTTMLAYKPFSFSLHTLVQKFVRTHDPSLMRDSSSSLSSSSTSAIASSSAATSKQCKQAQRFFVFFFPSVILVHLCLFALFYYYAMESSHALTASMDGVGSYNAQRVVWAHAVNNRELLKQALADEEITMIEADIMIDDEQKQPMMAHPPTILPDSPPFEEWISEILEHNARQILTGQGKMKGIKLDFKMPTAVQPCLNILKEKFQAQHQQQPQGFPIWLNADVLKGPGGQDSKFDFGTFVDLCQKAFPSFDLSLGWTTWIRFEEGLGYEDRMVDEMLEGCKKIKKGTHVTFAINGFYVKRSWKQMER